MNLTATFARQSVGRALSSVGPARVLHYSIGVSKQQNALLSRTVNNISSKGIALEGLPGRCHFDRSFVSQRSSLCVRTPELLNRTNSKGSPRINVLLSRGIYTSIGRNSSSVTVGATAVPSPGGAEGGKGIGALLLKWSARATALVLGLTAILVVALPSLLSTQLGMELFLKEANKYLPGRVEVAEARLAWTPVHKPMLTCVKVYDSPKGGTILLHLGSVSGSGPLHELVLAGLRQRLGWKEEEGSSPFRVTISNPWINAAYDAKYKDFKLVRWLELAGVLTPPPTVPILPPTVAQAVPEVKRNPAPPVSEEAKKLLVDQAAINPKSIAEVEDQLQALAAGVSNNADPMNKPVPDSTTSAWIAAVSKAGSNEDPAGVKKTPLVAALCRVNSKMGLRLDADVGHLALSIENALLLVPMETREAVGPDLNVTLALGKVALARLAASKEGQVWGLAESPSQLAAATVRRLRENAVAAAGAENILVPAVIRLQSQNVNGEARLWRVAAPAAPADVFVLDRPADIAVGFTPVASRLLLGSVNPLLAATAELEAGEAQDTAAQTLRATWWPEDMVMPFTTANAQVSPFRIRILPQTQVITALRALRILPPAAEVNSEPEAAPAAPELLCGPMQFKYDRSGRQAITDRVDMLINFGKEQSSLAGLAEAAGVEYAAEPRESATKPAPFKGVRILLWGSSDEQRDEIDMTIGLPMPTLRRIPGAAFEQLPENYVFPLTLKGRVAHPVPQLREAGSRLGALLAREYLLKSSAAVLNRAAPPAGEGSDNIIRALAGAVGRQIGNVALEVLDSQLAMATESEVALDLATVPPPVSDPRAWAVPAAADP